MRAFHKPISAKAMLWAGLISTLPAAVYAQEPFKERLTWNTIAFEINAVPSPRGTTLSITPSGLAAVNDTVSHDVPGSITRAEAGDIDADGSPEIYVYGVGSSPEKPGIVVAYAVNQGRSMSQISIPSIKDDPVNGKGYAGQDEWAIVEGILATRFPLFQTVDGVRTPTGKMRQLQFKLRPGEAGWAMVLDRAVEF